MVSFYNLVNCLQGCLGFWILKLLSFVNILGALVSWLIGNKDLILKSFGILSFYYLNSWLEIIFLLECFTGFVFFQNCDHCFNLCSSILSFYFLSFNFYVISG